jgi:hypothetical protein
VRIGSAVEKSQSLTVVSVPPDAIRRPSPETAMLQIPSRCPSQRRTSSPMPRSQIRMVLSRLPWGKDTVQKILNDPSYHGAPQRWGKPRVTGERVKETGRSRVEPVPPEQWRELADPTPPIIDRDTFDKANGTVDTRKIPDTNRAARAKNKHNFRLLRGLVHCGVCGRTMTSQSISKWKRKDGSNEGQRYHYYICMSGLGDKPDDVKCGNGRTQIEEVEAEAWRQVSALLEDEEKLREQVESVLRPDPSLDADMAVHAAEIAAAESKIKRLVSRLGDDDDELIVATLKEKIAEFKKVIADHRTALARLQERVADRDQVRAALARLDDLIGKPEGYLDQVASATLHGEPVTVREYLIALRREVMGTWTPEQRRQILITLGVKVYVARTDIQVEMSLPLGGSSGFPWGNSDKSPKVFTFRLTA